MLHSVRDQARTLAVAAAGAAVAVALTVPMPLLLGPLLACLLCALAGMKFTGFPRAASTMRTILGVAVGASITPESIHLLGDYATSIFLVMVLTGLIAAVGVPWFRACGFNRPTAFYAAVPGGLYDMLQFGIEAGADPRALSLAHATRLAVVVISLPLLLAGPLGVALDQPPGEPTMSFSATELAILSFCALGGWVLGRILSLPGASILGPMLLTVVCSLLGIVEKRPPSESILAAQFVLGLSVGVHYVGITLRELRGVVAATLGYCLVSAALAAGVISVVVAVGIAPLPDALLGFSPGGQAEMTVLAIVAGAELSYVVSLHLSRVVFVILGAPLLHGWMHCKRST